MYKNKIKKYKNNIVNSEKNTMCQLYKTFYNLLKLVHQNFIDKKFDDYLENTKKLINIVHQCSIVLTTKTSLNSEQTDQDIECLHSYFEGIQVALHQYLHSKDVSMYEKLINHFKDMENSFSLGKKVDHVYSPQNQLNSMNLDL